MQGQGLSFDGNGDYVNVGNISLAPTNAITVSSWVKPTTVGLIDKYVFSKRASYSLDAMRSFAAGADKPHFYITSGGVSGSAVSSVALNAGVWNHLVGTYNGSTIKIYLNNIQTASVNFGTGIDPSGFDANIGIDPWKTAATSFNGTIDEVLIYNRALSALEIQDIYNSQKP